LPFAAIDIVDTLFTLADDAIIAYWDGLGQHSFHYWPYSRHRGCIAGCRAEAEIIDIGYAILTFSLAIAAATARFTSDNRITRSY